MQWNCISVDMHRNFHAKKHEQLLPYQPICSEIAYRPICIEISMKQSMNNCHHIDRYAMCRADRVVCSQAVGTRPTRSQDHTLAYPDSAPEQVRPATSMGKYGRSHYCVCTQQWSDNNPGGRPAIHPFLHKNFSAMPYRKSKFDIDRYQYA